MRRGGSSRWIGQETFGGAVPPESVMQSRDKQGERDEEAAAGWRRVGRNFVPRFSGVGERKRGDAFPRRELPERRHRRSGKMQKPRPWPTFRLRWRRYDKTCTMLARFRTRAGLLGSMKGVAGAVTKAPRGPESRWWIGQDLLQHYVAQLWLHQYQRGVPLFQW